MDDEEYWGKVSLSDARKRNLLFSIVKGNLLNSFSVTNEYNIKEIKECFYFKKKDIAYYFDCFFIEKKPGKYCLTQDVQKEVTNIIDEHNEVRDKTEDAKMIFIKTFGRFRDECERHSDYNFKKFDQIYQIIQPIILILHWGILPIINKYLMVNSQSIPEDDVLKFYDHYHMLEAILSEINGEGEVMSLQGDNNLEQEMRFSVFSRRWGHKDNYRIKRTIDGWNVSHNSICGDCKKNGEGALFDNLHHDLIFFPEDGVKQALEVLWQEADEMEMGLEELQDKLDQIGNWISKVEKNLGETQPEWVKYY
ncbi:hypothetical protein [Acetobacterium tundrae]|uniref:Integron cassette protein domain-containing protein n=1 Tax=Acetobacterium tundrae TaxID=132932 RepID=A0ABR6WQW7_9FIRM|nr:hypothetical protein [Acetobacterium tundrae]MBC3798621.1 hypothetical protein [Acetobacterium tundrae]